MIKKSKIRTIPPPHPPIHNHPILVSPLSTSVQKKWSFPLKIYSVSVTEEIPNGKLDFLCSAETVGRWGEASKGSPVLIKKLLEENLKVEKWAKQVWSWS